MGGIASGILTMGKSGLAQEQSKETLLGNGYNYNLPKFDQGTKLLFQGDSITDMHGKKSKGPESLSWPQLCLSDCFPPWSRYAGCKTGFL